MFYEDLYIKIFSFLEWKEILELLILNKKLKIILEKDKLWKNIFENDKILGIKSKRDFMNSFLIVMEKEYKNYILEFDYLKEKYNKIYNNRLGKINWRIPNYIKVISIGMVRILKMRKFYEQNKLNLDKDYKIIFNRRIDEILKITEDYKKDLDEETN